MTTRTNTISTRVNILSNRLLREEQGLKRSQAVRRTKDELRTILENTLIMTGEGARELDKYRNVLDPIQPGDPANSIYDELQKLREDIGTAQYLLVHGKIEEADHLLQSAKERI